MLADRDYMREPSQSEPPRATTVLIIAGITCFVFFNIFLDIANKPEMQDLLYLSKKGLLKGYLWQIFTFQFLHLNLLHLALNMFSLYMFGRIVEDQIGQKKFLQLYFAAGIIGGLVQVLAGMFFPKFGGPVLGASAGCYGVMAAFSLLLWYDHFKVLLFFFIPVTLSGQFVFWLVSVSSIIGLGLTTIAIADGPQVAHAAHLGGFLSAFLFVKRGSAHTSFDAPFMNRGQVRRHQSAVGVGAGKKGGWWNKQAAQPVQETEAEPEDFISKQVDPILDKISAKGIHSLTEQERKILEKARSKMAKR
jgi:membrane associated rhomboid family serine protease